MKNELLLVNTFVSKCLRKYVSHNCVVIRSKVFGERMSDPPSVSCGLPCNLFKLSTFFNRSHPSIWDIFTIFTIVRALIFFNEMTAYQAEHFIFFYSILWNLHRISFLYSDLTLWHYLKSCNVLFYVLLLISVWKF